MSLQHIAIQIRQSQARTDKSEDQNVDRLEVVRHTEEKYAMMLLKDGVSGNSRHNDHDVNFVDIAVNVYVIHIPSVIQTHRIFKKHSSVLLSISMKKWDCVVLPFSATCQTECLTSKMNLPTYFTTMVNRPQN